MHPSEITKVIVSSYRLITRWIVCIHWTHIWTRPVATLQFWKFLHQLHGHSLSVIFADVTAVTVQSMGSVLGCIPDDLCWHWATLYQTVLQFPRELRELEGIWDWLVIIVQIYN